MSLVSDCKNILSIKIKTRQDSFFDHYTRLLMPKILLMSALVIGMNWFTDEVTCLVPSYVSFSSTFISDACWINGFYIYKALTNMSSNNVGYYGIPINSNYDGLYKSGRMCTSVDQNHLIDKDCTLMEKTFYLQYQWFPFFLASLMIIYYLPYALFKWNNEDLVSLQNSCKQSNADDIIESYFSKQHNGRFMVWSKFFVNTSVRILYLMSHIFTFVMIDVTFNYDFKTYGSRWLSWSKTNSNVNSRTFYTSNQKRPGETILPSFGLCDLQEGAVDKRYSVINTHRFICEFSAHVLYHYVFLILWFSLVLGISISLLGLLTHLVQPVYQYVKIKKTAEGAKLIRVLSIRELEYLDFIKRQNFALHESVWNQLIDAQFCLPKNKITFQSLHESLRDISKKLEHLEKNNE